MKEINIVLNDLETKYDQMKYNLVNIPTKVDEFINNWINIIKNILLYLVMNLSSMKMMASFKKSKIN